jgi:membrane protease YdiL (CAAX protease family)
VHTCPQCGAVSPASATWCSQCYLPFPAAAPEPAMVAAVPSRFGVAPALATSQAPVAAPPPVVATTGEIPAQPGWSPPAVPPPGCATPPTPAPPPPLPGADGRLLNGRAAVLVVVAIVLGAVMQGVATVLGHRTSLEPDTLIRYDIILTLGLYAIVATLIVSQITPSVRLRWGDGPVLLRIAIGVGVGAGLSGLLLFLVSANAGHLRPDPRIVLMMSEGDATHIVLAVLITCLAAPLVEETLFRGLLLESIRTYSTGAALVVSALAFAVWHLNTAALIYYSAMGAVLGGLYVKRGLAAAMAAHVGFNGVLTIAAIAVVLGPAHSVTADGVTITAPSGWSDATHTTANVGADLLLRGPDGAIVEVIGGPFSQPFDADAEVTRLQTAGNLFSSAASLDGSTVRVTTLPVGPAVEAEVSVEGRSGSVVVFGSEQRTIAVVFLNAGSDKAKADFAKMLSSMHAAV